MDQVLLLISLLLVGVCLGENSNNITEKSNINSTVELEEVKKLIPIRHCERCTQQNSVIYKYLVWGAEKQGEVTVCLAPGQVLRPGSIITGRASHPSECNRFRSNFKVTDLILSSQDSISTDCQQLLQLIFGYVEIYFDGRNSTNQQQFVENYKWICDPEGHFVKFVFNLTRRGNDLDKQEAEYSIYNIIIQAFVISGKKSSSFAFNNFSKLKRFQFSQFSFAGGLVLLVAGVICRQYIRELVVVAFTAIWAKITFCIRGSQSRRTRPSGGPTRITRQTVCDCSRLHHGSAEAL
jgi:hypothetical protein